MKIGQFGKLIITENGDIYNAETEKLLSTFVDARGNPMFRSPDTKSNFRVDYAVAMLFLNNGEFIEKITDYYIEHLDGDVKNCSASNLNLITDKALVKELRFGYLKSDSSNYSNRSVYPVYVANKETCSIETLSIQECAKKYKIAETTVVRKAHNCERMYKDNFKLYLCETMFDAWYCL